MAKVGPLFLRSSNSSALGIIILDFKAHTYIINATYYIRYNITFPFIIIICYYFC